MCPRHPDRWRFWVVGYDSNHPETDRPPRFSFRRLNKGRRRHPIVRAMAVTRQAISQILPPDESRPALPDAAGTMRLAYHSRAPYPRLARPNRWAIARDY